MFHFIFGLIWTAFSAFMTFAFYGGFGDGDITVNGVPTSQAEFNQMLGPKLFFGLFLLVGIIMLSIGIKKIITNILTKTRGVETYGYILDTYPNGTYVNDRPHYDAEILIVEEDETIGTYKEDIGFGYREYHSGIYIRLKHYKKDVNILGIVDNHSVPYNIKNKIEAELKTSNKYRDIKNEESLSNEETIYIDGVEYVRKEEDVILIDGVEYVKKK